jgi:hypothetical protein
MCRKSIAISIAVLCVLPACSQDRPVKPSSIDEMYSENQRCVTAIDYASVVDGVRTTTVSAVLSKHDLTEFLKNANSKVL